MTLFSLFLFDKVFINWGTCFARTRLSRQLPVCLVYMPMRMLEHVFSVYVCLSSIFYFVASVFWLHCLWSIFLLLWCICFQIANAHRFYIRGLNIHMAFIHGDGIGFTNILLLYTKCSGQEFLDSQAWVYSFYICGCVCFVALTSSTRLECWMHLVLMNLQDIGQTSIKISQHKCRATISSSLQLEPIRVINPVDAWFGTVSMTVLC